MLKITTWNMAYWTHKNLLDDVWKYSLNELDTDIFFFQEARLPKDLPVDHVAWQEIGGTRRWGSGIFSSNIKSHRLNSKINSLAL